VAVLAAVILVLGRGIAFATVPVREMAQMGETPRVAPLDKLSVAFVVVLSALFLGERVTMGTAAGVALMVAGALVLAQTR
jgi:transporter family protein